MSERGSFDLRIHIGLPWWTLDGLDSLLPGDLPDGMWSAQGVAEDASRRARGAALRGEELEAL